MNKISNTQQRLKQLMSEQNLKQVDIMNKAEPYKKELNIKMSKTHLSNYVTGRSTPDNLRLVLLSRVLGVSEPWLMGYDVPRNDSDVSPNNEPIIEETVSVMKKLEPPRQQIVLDTANLQLDEQQKIIEEAKKRERKILGLDKPPIDITKVPGYMPYEPDKMGMAPILGEIAAGYNIMAEENFDGMMAVSPEYAGRDDIFWLNIRGNSMESLIHDGSFGMFEHSEDIYDGSIGAAMSEDGDWITVKRIYHNYDENGYLLGLTLVPENEDCPTIEINEYNPGRVIGTLLEVKQFF
jgi:SOS-response transcriptional repressors (RecA-mediated autopeptidases)